MTAKDVDFYLAQLGLPHRRTLKALRKMIKEIVPTAEERIAYGMPAYMVNGKYVAGFGAFKNHCSFFPYSGSVLVKLESDLVAYRYSKGALQFAADKPLPKTLVRKLIATRKSQINIPNP